MSPESELNGGAAKTVIALAPLFRTKKSAAIFTGLFFVTSAFAGWGANYKLFAYRLDSQGRDIETLKSESARKVDEDKKQEQIQALLEAVRADIIASIHSEAEDRRADDQRVLKEIQHANERIDRILEIRGK